MPPQHGLYKNNTNTHTHTRTRTAHTAPHKGSPGQPLPLLPHTRTHAAAAGVQAKSTFSTLLHNTLTSAVRSRTPLLRSAGACPGDVAGGANGGEDAAADGTAHRHIPARASARGRKHRLRAGGMRQRVRTRRALGASRAGRRCRQSLKSVLPLLPVHRVSASRAAARTINVLASRAALASAIAHTLPVRGIVPPPPLVVCRRHRTGGLWQMVEKVALNRPAVHRAHLPLLAKSLTPHRPCGVLLRSRPRLLTFLHAPTTAAPS